MTSVSSAIRNDNWFTELASYRKNPQQYLSRNKLVEEAFLLDILQALFEDSLSVQLKSELLVVLQESYFLFDSVNNVEQCIGSLQNLYSHVMSDKHVSFHGLLCGQIFTTITTILLMHEEHLHTSSSLYSLFVQQIDLLWMQCSKNNSNKHLVKLASIQCLIEIERTFPGLLTSKLESLKKCCHQEKTFLFQPMTILFSMVLKSERSDVSSDSIVGKFRNSISSLNTTSSNATSKRSTVKQHLMYINDLLPSMNSTAVYTIINNLLDVHNYVEDISPIIYKTLLLRYLHCSDCVSFSVVLLLQEKFEDVLFSEQEYKQLVNQMLIQTIHPSLFVSHRLLLLNWCVEKISLFKKYSINQVIQKKLRCSVFDGADSQHIKQKLLSLILQSESSVFYDVNALMSSLNILKSRIVYRMQDKVVFALFRSLYCFYVHHSHHTVVKSSIQKLIFDLTVDQPMLAYNFLDFIQSIMAFDINSDLPQELLIELVKNVTSLNTNELSLDSVKYYLVILERAANEPPHVSQPLAIVNFLNKLIDVDARRMLNDWLLGNSMLAVCKNLLYRQHSDVVYVQIGDLLHKVSTFHGCDVDVRDHARICYTMLTSLSSNKLSTMMQNSMNVDDHQDLCVDSIVSDNSRLRIGVSILQIDHPVFEIKRVTRAIDPLSDISSDVDHHPLTDALETYFSYVKSDDYRPVVQIRFTLEIIQDLDDETFDELYSLVLSIEGPSTCDPISDVVITSIRRSRRKPPATVCVELTSVRRAIPTKLKLSAVFNKRDGQTCACHLPDVDVRFEDYFLPLPVPPSVDMQEELRRYLVQKCVSRDRGECEKSLFRLRSTRHRKFGDLMASFKSGRVDASSDHRSHRVTVLVPPSNHICFEFQVVDSQPETMLVTIVTDSWTLFPMIDDLFDDDCCDVELILQNLFFK